MDELREKIGSKIDVVLKRVMGNVYPAIIRASLTKDIMDLVKEKELVWEKSDISNMHFSGEYVVQNEYGCDLQSDWAFGVRDKLISRHATIDEAKAAAQAHYNRMWLDMMAK